MREKCGKSISFSLFFILITTTAVWKFLPISAHAKYFFVYFPSLISGKFYWILEYQESHVHYMKRTIFGDQTQQPNKQHKTRRIVAKHISYRWLGHCLFPQEWPWLDNWHLHYFLAKTLRLANDIIAQNGELKSKLSPVAELSGASICYKMCSFLSVRRNNFPEWSTRLTFKISLSWNDITTCSEF